MYQLQIPGSKFGKESSKLEAIFLIYGFIILLKAVLNFSFIFRLSSLRL